MNTHRLLATIAIFLFKSVTLAQTNTGQIKGVLRDRTRAVIPGANITATNVATGLTLARVTDSAGEFVFPSLAVGEWTISAAANGFKQLVKPGVILQLGQVVDLELQLEVGEVTVTEMVTVTSAGQILQTATGEVSDVVERERVAELPLNGRQFLQLALLSEGVVKPPGGTRGSALQQAGELVNVLTALEASARGRRGWGRGRPAQDPE